MKYLMEWDVGGPWYSLLEVMFPFVFLTQHKNFPPVTTHAARPHYPPSHAVQMIPTAVDQLDTNQTEGKEMPKCCNTKGTLKCSQ